MAEPVWVRDDVVLAIHRRQLAEHGGTEGIRDRGLLESALARPKNRFAYAADKADLGGLARPKNRFAYAPHSADLAALAAAYAFGIARNHPFVDGNKRTALVVCRTFLALNGFDLTASQAEKYETFMGLARGERSEDELAAWLRTPVSNE